MSVSIEEGRITFALERESSLLTYKPETKTKLPHANMPQVSDFHEGTGDVSHVGFILHYTESTDSLRAVFFILTVQGFTLTLPNHAFYFSEFV